MRVTELVVESVTEQCSGLSGVSEKTDQFHIQHYYKMFYTKNIKLNPWQPLHISTIKDPRLKAGKKCKIMGIGIQFIIPLGIRCT